MPRLFLISPVAPRTPVSAPRLLQPALHSQFEGENIIKKKTSLSGLPFFIGIEPLSNALQKDQTIKVFRRARKKKKLTQYASDTMALVLDSVLHLPKLLNNLKNISALEVNKRKTA